MADFLGSAKGLTVEADALEPVMQAEKNGKSHAAMHFGGGARHEGADFGGVRLGMRRHALRLFGKFVEGVSGIPDERAARFEFGDHLGTHMLDGLERGDDAPELLALL